MSMGPINSYGTYCDTSTWSTARIVDGTQGDATTTFRQIIREEVTKALHPVVGVVDPREFQRVEISDTDGKRWRGMVYLVEEEPGL